MALFKALGIVNRTNNNLPHEADILSEGKKKINSVLYNHCGEVVWNILCLTRGQAEKSTQGEVSGLKDSA